MRRHRLSRLVYLTQIRGTILQRGVAVSELPLMQVNNRRDEFTSGNFQVRRLQYCRTTTLFTSQPMSMASQLGRMKTHLEKKNTTFEYKTETELRKFPLFGLFMNWLLVT